MTDRTRDLDALFAARLARIPVPDRRARAVPRRSARAVAAAVATGVILASTVAVFDAAAQADSQGAACASLATKLQLYVGSATAVKAITPGAPKGAPSTDARAAMPAEKRDALANAATKPTVDAARVTKAAVTPIATCVINGETITVYKTDEALRASR